MFKKLPLLMATTLLCSCATRIGDFTVASTKNINMKDRKYTIDNSRITGEDVKPTIIVFKTGQPNMKEAMDQAIEKIDNAVGLSNVTVKHGQWYIPFIGGAEWYEVEGNPIIEKTVTN